MFEQEKPFILTPKRNAEAETEAKRLGQFASWNWIDAVDYDAVNTKNATDSVVKAAEYAYIIMSGLNVYCAEFVVLNMEPTKAAFEKFLKDFNTRSYFNAQGVIVYTYENGVRTSSKKGSLEEVMCGFFN